MENLNKNDLSNPKLRKMLRKDKQAQAISWVELRALWKAPPATHIRHPRMPRYTLLEKSVDQDPNRATSLQSAMLAHENKAARRIQHGYKKYRTREKFRAWVRLAMNSDAGRNKCAILIGSKFWRRVQCQLNYRCIHKAVVSLQTFYRLVHARKVAMKVALMKLRQSLREVLGQEWSLVRIVTAVENNGRKKDRARIRLATSYLVHQGHGPGMSVPGVLRLCHELKKTKKSCSSRKRKQMKQWKKKRPVSWEKDTSSQVSHWYDRQRKSRERKSMEEGQFRLNRLKILEKRREKKQELLLLEMQDEQCNL